MAPRRTINRASALAGLHFATIVKLVQDGTLKGVIDGPADDRYVEYQEGWTPGDLWQQVCDRGFAFDDEEAVVRLVKTKQRLGCSDVRWSREFLQALVEVREGRHLSKREARKVLGNPIECWQPACELYNELAGSAARSGSKYEPLELDELIAEAPEPLQSLGGSCLDPDRGILFERPSPDATARAGAMPIGHLRWVSTFAILVHPTHGGHGARLPAMLAMLERIAPGIEHGSITDEPLMARVMRDAYEGGRGPRGQDFETVASYLELRDLLLAWFEWQKLDAESETGEFLLSLLPADLPNDLKAVRWKDRARMSVETLKARAISAGEVARRAAHRLLCVDARLRQWDRITTVIDAEMAVLQADFDAGRTPTFPVRVSDTWKVVRPDGSVAPTLRQTVRFEIVTESMLWLETAKASDWDSIVEAYLSAEMRGLSPARIAAAERAENRTPVSAGANHRPGGDRRLFAVYVGTDPAARRDDEHHPPHLVEIYSVSGLIDSQYHTPDLKRRRAALVDEMGLGRHPTPMMGLTWWQGRTNAAMPHLALRHANRLVLPYRQMRLMLAYGCAVARLELMSGLRLGEAMQGRHGGCFSERPLDDRIVATMRGRPKGFMRDRLWVIDRKTMSLLRQIKGWVIENWYADLGALPFVAYGEPSKNRERMQCPPARYLLQMAGRAALNWELNRCLQIATLGLPHAKAHDYRYAFAKLLRMMGGSKRARARAMSHDVDSSMVERYGDFDCEGFEDGDGIVVQHQEELEREVFELMIDAG